MSRSQQFPAEASAVRQARRFVTGELDGGDREWIDLVALATSEVASNCVLHARTDFTITVDRTSRGVRVTAVDDGAGVPQMQHPDPFTPTGRGLLIVARLSDAWGSEHAAGHNEVWFEINEPEAGASGQASGGAARGDEPGRRPHHGQRLGSPPERRPGRRRPPGRGRPGTYARRR
jgi:anti-sigma regulatory factor (Ser/Thr protein kinase)